MVCFVWAYVWVEIIVFDVGEFRGLLAGSVAGIDSVHFFGRFRSSSTGSLTSMPLQ